MQLTSTLNGALMHRTALTVLFVIFTAAPAGVRSDTVHLEPVKDNSLFQNATGEISSGSGPALFVGNNSGSNTRRAVLAFDIASAVPSGSEIRHVELRLHVSNAPNSTPRVITLHRVFVDWGEGASSSSGGAGAPSAPGDATWLHTFYPDNYWTRAGGDFDAVASANTVVGDVGFYTWSASKMSLNVQQWLDYPETNFGWLLKGEETQASTARRVDSRENAVEENRPVLVVEFQPATVPVEPSTWSRVKSLFLEGGP